MIQKTRKAKGLTIAAIAKTLDLPLERVEVSFQLAFRKYKGMNKKARDYSLKDCYRGLEWLDITEIQRQILKEEYIPQDFSDGIKTVRGTDVFYRLQSKNPERMCCCSCTYCTPMFENGLMVPYCRYFDRSHKSMKADPYWDFCGVYSFTYRDEPLVFYKRGSPINHRYNHEKCDNFMGFPMSLLSNDENNHDLICDIGVKLNEI